ncbi:beta-glucosidase [Roseateles sp. LYH14W]
MQSNSDNASDWPHSADVANRVREILGKMTLDDKIELVTGDLNHNHGFYSAAVDSAGIPALAMADGPPGLRLNMGINDGKATAMPAPIALAASWNLNLATRYGEVLGAECRLTGHNVFLGPAVDIARAPLSGRIFESSGEDPLLNGRMAAAQVDAIQKRGVLCSLKHFACNNQEYLRASIDVQADERTQRELYLRPFEIVLGAVPVASVMGAFNRVNGTYSCEHQWLLRTVLREEMGFRGWVMSDYGATHSTVPSALAGLDQEQPASVHYGASLKMAVNQGDVPVETLDAMCARILRTVIGLDLIGRDESPRLTPADTESHREHAQAVAEEGIVLLKNDGPMLPIDAGRLRRVLVVGVDADGVGAAGGGSGKVRPAHGVSLLDGLRHRLGPEVEVEYAQGCDPVSAADLLAGEESIPSTFFRQPDDSGYGLRAEFWANPDHLGDPHTTLTMPQVALNLGFFNFPGCSAASPKYPTFANELTPQTSSRFTGRLLVPVDGHYHLTVTVLGTVRIWLDGELVLDFRYHGNGVASGGGSGGFGDIGLPAVFEADTDSPSKVGAAAASSPIGLSEDIDIAGGVSGPDPAVVPLALALCGGAQGHDLRIEYAADSPAQGWLTGAQLRLGWRPPTQLLSHHIRHAVELAARADLVVVAARAYESEHTDRPSTRLPNNQRALIRAVAAANACTVVVTMSGGPLETISWENGVPALLHAWYAGQEQGAALARIIFGDVCPSGRLPITFPLGDHDGLFDPQIRRHYPGVDGRVHYDEGVEVGYRGFDARQLQPRFEFGFGLSYTKFEYSELSTERVAEGIAVRFTVKNIGERAGQEVAQLYLSLPVEGEPPKRLVDWSKVRLEAGEAADIRLLVRCDSHERPLEAWRNGVWRRASGTVGVLVGASSRDVRLRGAVAL